MYNGYPRHILWILQREPEIHFVSDPCQELANQDPHPRDVNQKSRHHPLGSTAQTERKLHDILAGRYNKIPHHSAYYPVATARKNLEWRELLLSLGIELHDNYQPMKKEIFYVDDPSRSGYSSAVKRLAIPKELAMKILTLGTMP